MTVANHKLRSFASRLSATRLHAFAASGTASIVFGALVSNLLRIASSVTLTRLLSAEAFGVVGIITSMAFVLTLLSDVGLYPFLVRHAETRDPGFLDRIWTLRLIRSVALTIVMSAAAWPVALFLGKPALTWVFVAWSASFAIEGLSSLTFATAVREGRLWRLTVFEVLAAIVTLILSIILALVLHSYWALVIAMLIGASSKSLLSYLMFPGSRRRFILDRARARELWTFSRFIAASSLLTMLIMQSDKLVLARLMSLEAYGLYAIATTLASAPMALAAAYATRVLFPAYAELARRGALTGPRAFYPKRRLITLAYMAGVGGMIGGAKLIVALLYDPRYASVTPYFQLVAISSALYIVTIVSEEALVAAGRTRWTLYGNIARVVWLAAGGAIALLTGNVMLLVAVVGTREAAAMLSGWTGLRRAGLLDLREEALGLGALCAGAILGYGVATEALLLYPNL